MQKYHTFYDTTTVKLIVNQNPTQETETSTESIQRNETREFLLKILLIVLAPTTKEYQHQHEALTTKHIPIPQIQKEDDGGQLVFGMATAVGGGLIVLILFVVLVILRRFRKIAAGVEEKRNNGTIGVKSKERATSNGE